MARFLAPLAVVATMALAPAAFAQNAALTGSYRLNPAKSDNVHQAIDQAISRMNALLRPVARGRLRSTNQPYQRVAITQTGTQVSIATDGRAAIVTPASGAPVRWRREDGETLNVSTRWNGQTLVQTFAAPDGTRQNAYTLNPDGSMTMRVTVTSPRLSRPLVYNLGYAK